MELVFMLREGATTNLIPMKKRERNLEKAKGSSSLKDTKRKVKQFWPKCSLRLRGVIELCTYMMLLRWFFG